MSFDGKATRARKAATTEVDSLHKRAFTVWVNANLRKRDIEIKDLYKDLSDGLVLIALTEVLTGKEFDRKKLNEQPATIHHKIDNVTQAIAFLRPHVGALQLEPKDVVEGNSKVILALIWRLLVNFQILEKAEDADANASTVERAREAKNRLLTWANERLVRYNLKLNNLDTDLHDGYAFCALLNAYNPTLLDFSKIDRANARANLARALRLAEEEMNVPRMLEVDDFFGAVKPDEQIMMTYLSEWPRVFASRVVDEGVHEEVVQSVFLPLKLEAASDSVAVDPLVELKRKENELLQREKEHRQLQAQLSGAAAADKAAADSALAREQELAAQLERMRRENEALRANLSQIKQKLIGQLRVEVLQARNIRPSGKSDSYCTLTLERQREKTKTVRKTLHPQWDAEFGFFVSEPDSELWVTVWDHERFLRDRCLGCVSVSVTALTDGATDEQWRALQPRKPNQKVSGDILLKITYSKEH